MIFGLTSVNGIDTGRPRLSDAQSMCVRFGGYLAEIDSDIEYEIIRSFVIRHKSRGTVLVGGTDSLSERTWINRYRLTPIVPLMVRQTKKTYLY
ncbi:hypothetical protein Btru_064886 [Bulinus truncatus]|nr:hypothetical protein Btru_064886 [Bulinus truncatus]